MGIKTELKIDGVMILTGVATVTLLGVVGYLWVKKDAIAESISKGTVITSKDNYVNRGVVHVLGLSEQGYGDLGSWFYCLTHPDSVACPKQSQASR